MDVLLAEFLAEALAQRTQCKLARCEGAGRHVPSHACRRPGEQKRSPLPELVHLVLLEGEEHLARERKGCNDVGVDDGLELLLRDVEEAFPDSCPGVPESDTDLRLFRRRPLVRLDILEDGSDGWVGIGGDWECSGLRR